MLCCSLTIIQQPCEQCIEHDTDCSPPVNETRLVCRGCETRKKGGCRRVVENQFHRLWEQTIHLSKAAFVEEFEKYTEYTVREQVLQQLMFFDVRGTIAWRDDVDNQAAPRYLFNSLGEPYWEQEGKIMEESEVWGDTDVNAPIPVGHGICARGRVDSQAPEDDVVMGGGVDEDENEIIGGSVGDQMVVDGSGKAEESKKDGDEDDEYGGEGGKLAGGSHMTPDGDDESHDGESGEMTVGRGFTPSVAPGRGVEWSHRLRRRGMEVMAWNVDVLDALDALDEAEESLARREEAILEVRAELHTAVEEKTRLFELAATADSLREELRQQKAMADSLREELRREKEKPTTADSLRKALHQQKATVDSLREELRREKEEKQMMELLAAMLKERTEARAEQSRRLGIAVDELAPKLRQGKFDELDRWYASVAKSSLESSHGDIDTLYQTFLLRPTLGGGYADKEVFIQRTAKERAEQQAPGFVEEVGEGGERIERGGDAMALTEKARGKQRAP